LRPLFWEPHITNAEFDVTRFGFLDTANIYATSELYDVREKYERLMAKSDIVFLTAEKLREDFLSVAKDKDVVTISNGVNADFFEDNRCLGLLLPCTITGIESCALYPACIER